MANTDAGKSIHEHFREQAHSWDGGLMSVLFIAVAVVALYFAFFVKNPWLRAGALAYFLLP